ncbi:MAG: hypothetical protein OHK0046_17110 [Anaerolineae bacterium]
MTIAKPQDAYLSHLQKLISLWENLLEAQTLSNKKYYELYERSKTILNQICPDDQIFIDKVESPSSENIERLIGKLRAAQLDLRDGILSLEHQIQAKISIDLMQQAEELLSEGKSGNFEHIPAAVLAGAVLEHFLRILCSRQSPPISLNLDNGNLKTLATLVNDLEKIGRYNSVEKKQLKVWVEIRNAAAHGQFDHFTHEQVKNMIEGIKRFIEDHK